VGKLEDPNTWNVPEVPSLFDFGSPDLIIGVNVQPPFDPGDFLVGT
jgi:hypothetical protein